MTTIVTRTAKGSPLTHVEVDTNFTNLNTNKLEAGAIALGSAGTPSISFTGDTNTGIFSPGADQLGITTAGVERVRVGLNGHVAIGNGSTITDFNFLNIQGSNVTHTVGVVLNKTDTTAQIWGMRNTGPLTFYNYTANTAALTITTGGLVGIGTTGPTRSLEVAVGATSNNGILVTGSNSPGILISETSGSVNLNLVNDASGAYIGTSSNHYLVLRTNNTERARIDTSGRLLVGTASTTGLNSNVAPVVAGNFMSFEGSVSASHNTATTLFTLENLNATYIITALVAGSNATHYHAVYVIGSIAVPSHSIQALKAGSFLTMSLSGSNVQVTQTSGVSQTITWSVTRMANI